MALIKAVSAGRVRQIRILLDHGISIEQKDDCGHTALANVVFLEHDRHRQKITRLLLKRGAVVSNADIVGRNPLAWAALYGRSKEITIMLRHADVGLNLNHTDINGQTVLFHAVTSGSAATVKLIVDALKKYSLSVDVPDASGITPLLQAVHMAHDVCASILVHQGHAKVGIDSQFTQDFINAKKWAVKPQSERRLSFRTDPQSKFPAIIPQTAWNRIKLRENRAAQLRILSPMDSDDEDSSYGSDISSCFTDSSIDSICLDSHCGGDLPSSILAITGVSSDDDLTCSAMQCYFGEKPIRVKKKETFKPTKDLNKLFRLYEAELASSFRPDVMKNLPHDFRWKLTEDDAQTVTSSSIESFQTNRSKTDKNSTLSEKDFTEKGKTTRPNRYLASRDLTGLRKLMSVNRQKQGEVTVQTANQHVDTGLAFPAIPKTASLIIQTSNKSSQNIGDFIQNKTEL